MKTEAHIVPSPCHDHRTCVYLPLPCHVHRTCVYLPLSCHVHRTCALLPLLGAWFRAKHRSLPWREDPTPYHVWVSEIMLQQTRVEAVKAYYLRFMERLPDIASLAQVPEDELMKLWEGLGYYSRARNLKKCAVAVTEQYQGELPKSYDLLIKLPGIGAYTAGAIASIAYHLPYAAVDGNVLRVMSRVEGCFEDISQEATKRAWKETLEEMLRACPQEDSGVINQALMELGATVCIPNGAPLCEKCPLEHLCQAWQKGLTEVLPVKAAKKPRKIYDMTVLLLLCGAENQVLLCKRPEKGILAGLYEYPNESGHLTPEEVLHWWEERIGDTAVSKNELPLVPEIRPLPEGKHIFTHLEWHMIGYALILPKDTDLEQVAERLASFDQNSNEKKKDIRQVLWADQEQLEQVYAVPGAFRIYTEEVRKILEK